jgi:hypothetical protein
MRHTHELGGGSLGARPHVSLENVAWSGSHAERWFAAEVFERCVTVLVSDQR